MTRFTPELKHHILTQYVANVREKGFRALARHYAIKGGHSVVRRWHERWDGTSASLKPRKSPGRPRVLTHQQVTTHILNPIRRANRAHKAIHYPQIRRKLIESTHKSPSLRTVQRYGKKTKVRQRHTTKRTARELHIATCDDIATLRRELQGYGGKHLLYLDETHLRISDAPLTTLVAPGEQPIVIVEDTTAYAKRYDMIACCSSDRVFPPIIWSPDERTLIGSKGINKDMLLRYINDILGPAVGALDRYPLYLVLDRATIHNCEHIREAFHEAGCHELVKVIQMPTQAAKRMSPLDNAIFHDWKQECRKKEGITERNIVRIMSDAWNNIKPSTLRAHYSHCLLNRGDDPYGDCPNAHAHQHPRPRLPAVPGRYHLRDRR